VVARLVIVLALLAGVVGAASMHCIETMDPGLVAEHHARSDNHRQETTQPDHHEQDSHGMGGLLITCLAFLIAVVTAMVGLRPALLRGLVAALRPPAMAASRSVLPRAPRLADLCLMRT
jgi:hypothetical protein